MVQWRNSGFCEPGEAAARRGCLVPDPVGNLRIMFEHTSILHKTAHDPDLGTA